MDRTTAIYEADVSTVLDGRQEIRLGRLTTFGGGIVLGIGLALAAVTLGPGIRGTAAPDGVAVEAATATVDTRSLTERYSQSYDWRPAAPADPVDTRSLTERYSQSYHWPTSGTVPD